MVADVKRTARDESSGKENNHGPKHASHGAARFLEKLDPETPLDELGPLYETWRDCDGRRCP